MCVRISIAALLLALVAGCTTAGDTEPGEQARQMVCEKGTLKVCTAYTGDWSRLKKETLACSCQ